MVKGGDEAKGEGELDLDPRQESIQPVKIEAKPLKAPNGSGRAKSNKHCPGRRRAAAAQKSAMPSVNFNNAAPELEKKNMHSLTLTQPLQWSRPSASSPPLHSSLP